MGNLPGLTCNCSDNTPTAFQFQFTTIEAQDLRLCVRIGNKYITDAGDISSYNVKTEIISFKADGTLDQLKEAVNVLSFANISIFFNNFRILGYPNFTHPLTPSQQPQFCK